jgi:hypothetical protein
LGARDPPPCRIIQYACGCCSSTATFETRYPGSWRSVGIVERVVPNVNVRRGLRCRYLCRMPPEQSVTLTIARPQPGQRRRRCRVIADNWLMTDTRHRIGQRGCCKNREYSPLSSLPSGVHPQQGTFRQKVLRRLPQLQRHPQATTACTDALSARSAVQAEKECIKIRLECQRTVSVPLQTNARTLWKPAARSQNENPMPDLPGVELDQCHYKWPL